MEWADALVPPTRKLFVPFVLRAMGKWMQVASRIARGQIDHRGVCGHRYSVQDGTVAQKTFCCESRVSILQWVCEKQCQDRPNQPSTCVQQPVLRQGQCSQQGNTLSCSHAHACPVCSTVVWTSHSCGPIEVKHDMPSGKPCDNKRWHIQEKKAKKKQNKK